MKKLKYIIVLLCFGCSSPKVVYDYDVKTNFSQYRTYHFFDDVGDGVNELDVKRFVSSIEYQLDSIGLKKSEKPDIYINIMSEKSELSNGNNVGIGIGSGGRNIGIGISTGITLEGRKINERITIDFVMIIVGYTITISHFCVAKNIRD